MRACLNDKSTCFWDGHKVSSHFWVRYCNWATRFDLLFKEWNHTSSTSEYVPEPNRDKVCIALSIHTLHDHFSNPFTFAHDVGWVNGLICCNYNKCFHVAFSVCFSNVFRTNHVI